MPIDLADGNEIYGLATAQDLDRVIKATLKVEAMARTEIIETAAQSRTAQPAFFRVTATKDATGKVWPMVLVTRAWAESGDPLIDPATLATTWVDGEVGYALEVNGTDLVVGNVYGGVITDVLQGYPTALCNVSLGGTASVNPGMARIINPVVVHSSGTCVKAKIQKWTNTPVYTPLDDFEVWLRVL